MEKENQKSIISLFSAFKGIEFTEHNHTYTMDGKRLTSVTTIIKQYQNPFDEEYWSRYIALKRMGYRIRPGNKGKTVFINNKEYDIKEYSSFTDIKHKDIIKEWNNIAEEGRTNGSAAHAYLEKAFFGKYPAKRNPVLDAIVHYVTETCLYVPMYSEFIVADKDMEIAGQIDLLCIDGKGNVVIIDFKTDKELKTANKYDKLLSPLSELDDCNFNKYIVQLNLYRKLLIPYVDIPNMYIVHIKEGDFEWYDIPILDNIDTLINDYNRKRTLVA